jgi:hypothetical protein
MMRRALAWTAAVSALLAVFMAYLQPVFVVDLATQIWSCF